jgi:hypothetical protein
MAVRRPRMGGHVLDHSRGLTGHWGSRVREDG